MRGQLNDHHSSSQPSTASYGGVKKEVGINQDSLPLLSSQCLRILSPNLLNFFLFLLATRRIDSSFSSPFAITKAGTSSKRVTPSRVAGIFEKSLTRYIDFHGVKLGRFPLLLRERVVGKATGFQSLSPGFEAICPL